MLQLTAEPALLALLNTLEARKYNFVTPLNETTRLRHGRSPAARARDLRDALGWSLPWSPGDLDDEIEALLLSAGVVREVEDGFCCTVRVSRVHGLLFLHSAFPTDEVDSVFLGPDSYRFAEFIRGELSSAPPCQSICDIGTGSGVGGVVAGALTGAGEVHLVDINPKALQLAKVNAAHAQVAARLHLSAGAAALDLSFDVIVANPPFIAEESKTYCDGGSMLGSAVSLSWAIEAMERLAPGGRLLLYTGSAIVDGQDGFRDALEAEASQRACTVRYRELDPDIFHEELRRPAYAGVERIAAIGAVVTRG